MTLAQESRPSLSTRKRPSGVALTALGVEGAITQFARIPLSWALAIVALAGLREKMKYSDIPEGLQRAPKTAKVIRVDAQKIAFEEKSRENAVLIGALAAIARAAEPLVVGWLGLPAEMANALLVGFMRRDFGAVYVLDAATGAGAILSQHQILVAMVTITLFMPCFATLLMITKEHGKKTALGMVAFIFPFAILIGGLVNKLGLWLGNI